MDSGVKQRVRDGGDSLSVSDAAISNSDPIATGSTKQTYDWLCGITSYMETVLKALNDGLSHLHAPYAYGFAIILVTLIVKAATFPLTKKQVEYAMAIRSLQPQIKAIQERYAGDQERIQLETARIYKLAGINPLAGCFPTLATIPIWTGLYRALSNVYALLASGFVELVIESGLKPYDFLALVPVIEGAGGVITDWEGQELHWEASSQSHATDESGNK